VARIYLLIRNYLSCRHLGEFAMLPSMKKLFHPVKWLADCYYWSVTAPLVRYHLRQLVSRPRLPWWQPLALFVLHLFRAEPFPHFRGGPPVTAC